MGKKSCSFSFLRIDDLGRFLNGDLEDDIVGDDDDENDVDKDEHELFTFGFERQVSLFDTESEDKRPSSSSS